MQNNNKRIFYRHLNPLHLKDKTDTRTTDFFRFASKMFNMPKFDQGKEENAKQLPDCSSVDKYFNNYYRYNNW